MAMFRTKPVIIEATQFNVAGDHPAVFADTRSPTGFATHRIERTASGAYTLSRVVINHEVTSGDWIITAARGEVYPCKPDVFFATYEPVG